MSIDMQTFGSAVRFNDGMNETEAVNTAKSILLHPAGYMSFYDYRKADLGDIEDATTLVQLFGAFRQVLIRKGENGPIIGCLGHDDRHYNPAPLFAALARFLQDGSWYAYKYDSDEYSEIVLYIHDGELHTYDVDLVAFNTVPVDASDEGVTHLARVLTGNNELLDGLTRPPLSIGETHALLNNMSAFVS